MGINLRDYVENINELFTEEEAERLFITAGYKQKRKETGINKEDQTDCQKTNSKSNRF